MSELRDRLDDLLVETPSYVVPDAGAAWRAGARRRHRRRAGAGALVVVLVLLVGLGLGALPRPGTVDPARTDGAGVDGYPTRVDLPRRISDLPDAPGPVAGIAMSLTPDRGRYLVTAGGRLLELAGTGPLADSYPALSDDGRMLGYLESETRYVLRDLAAGTTVEVAGLGINIEGIESDYWMQGQVPGFWSPSGERLAIYASSWDRQRGPNTALVDRTGILVPLRTPVVPGRRGAGGVLVGWLDDERIGWLQERSTGTRTTVDLVTTRVDGAEVGRVKVDVPARSASWVNQWTGSISPDRTTLYVRDDQGGGYLLDVRTGEQTWRGAATSPDLCLTSWQGGEPLALADDALRNRSHAPIVATAPDLRCVQLAPLALTGDRHRGLNGLLFGTRTSWLSWHWREVGLGLAFVGGWFGFLTWLQRRRARRGAGDVVRPGGHGDRIA